MRVGVCSVGIGLRLFETVQKRIVTSFFGLLFLWPVLLIVAIMVKIKMPGGPAFFVQKRVERGGKLFNCHKFRSMTVNHSGSSVSVEGDIRITPFGAKLYFGRLSMNSIGSWTSCRS